MHTTALRHTRLPATSASNTYHCLCLVFSNTNKDQATAWHVSWHFNSKQLTQPGAALGTAYLCFLMCHHCLKCRSSLRHAGRVGCIHYEHQRLQQRQVASRFRCERNGADVHGMAQNGLKVLTLLPAGASVHHPCCSDISAVVCLHRSALAYAQLLHYSRCWLWSLYVFLLSTVNIKTQLWTLGAVLQGRVHDSTRQPSTLLLTACQRAASVEAKASF